jgi:hypothetical protein
MVTQREKANQECHQGHWDVDPTVEKIRQHGGSFLAAWV